MRVWSRNYCTKYSINLIDLMAFFPTQVVITKYADVLDIKINGVHMGRMLFIITAGSPGFGTLQNDAVGCKRLGFLVEAYEKDRSGEICLSYADGTLVQLQKKDNNAMGRRTILNLAGHFIQAWQRYAKSNAEPASISLPEITPPRESAKIKTPLRRSARIRDRVFRTKRKNTEDLSTRSGKRTKLN